MTRTLLRRESLSEFLKIAARFGAVHGPVTRDEVVTFGPVATAADLHLDYSRTLIPPKKYLLPHRETIATFDPQQGYQPSPPDPPETLLLGLHPCDLQGIAYLDQVFLADRPDPHYRARRDRLMLVGLSCEPDDYCFCGDLAGAPPCDLFMRRAAAGFHLSAPSPRGAALLAALAPLLVEAPPAPDGAPTAEVARRIAEAAAHGEHFPGSPLWERFASRCLSCGACSLCCPTCYCFDVRENGALDGAGASRMREWDNCLFKAHGEVAGGANFRRTRLERFHYRFQHKYLGFGPTRGMQSCVGCGRCRQVCPVGIDLLELFGEQKQ